MTLHQRFRLGDIVEDIGVRQDEDDGTAYSRLDDVQDTFSRAIRYEPKRLAHHPDRIIDVVCAAPAPASFLYTAVGVPVSVSGGGGVELPVSNLSLKPSNTDAIVQPFACSPQWPFNSSPLGTFKQVVHQAVSTARPSMPLFSAMATDISQLKQQLQESTDQNSDSHKHILQRLVQMEQKQDEMLREQAESKLREEQILARLIVAQQ
ncbi:hypothetical protein BGZ95_006805, partial [Linnemannia exigua]